MKLSLDRTFRVIWLAVGGLLLLFLVVGGVMVVAQVIGNAGASDDAARVVGESTAAPAGSRAVRYEMPRHVRGTASTRIVQVEGGFRDGDYPYSRGSESSTANVVFLDAGGARLLLDRPARIRGIQYPADDARGENAVDTQQTWITYVMALDDSNRDGDVNDRDAMGLYVTDLEGRGLRPVVRPPLVYRSHQALEGGRILVYALEPPAGKPVEERRMRQRAFVYEVASGRLSPYAALDSAAQRAGEILARPGPRGAR